MKRFAKIGTLLILALSLGTGCLVGRHGHIAMVPPPALLVAGAIAAAAATHPGEVWVDGHWDWVDGRWVWHDGYWMGARPGFIWIQGGWVAEGPRYVYRPGRWEAPSYQRVEVR